MCSCSREDDAGIAAELPGPQAAQDGVLAVHQDRERSAALEVQLQQARQEAGTASARLLQLQERLAEVEGQAQLASGASRSMVI